MKKYIIKNQPFIFSGATSAGLIMATLVLGAQPTGIIAYTLLPSLVVSILLGHATFRDSFLHWGKLPPFRIQSNKASQEHQSDFQQERERQLIIDNRMRLVLWTISILIFSVSLTYKFITYCF